MELKLCDFCLKKIASKPKGDIGMEHTDTPWADISVWSFTTKALEKYQFRYSLCEDCLKQVIEAVENLKKNISKKETVIKNK